MKYSIYKDSDVNKTVDKIKQITSECGIELEELIIKYPIQDKRMPYSLALKVFNQIQTNGKGTSLENARASAYAEFMERLQNNNTPSLKFYTKNFKYSPDEKISDEIDKIFYERYGKEYLNLIKKEESGNNTFITAPFYNIKKHDILDIPIKVLLRIQGSNGMCAGNTPEEAIVQGLSEIYERYSMYKIILNNISMPDIPKEIWSKYNRIVEMKEYIEQYGYEVRIKDASLGENLPVVCVLFENKKDGYFSFNFGAQPSLPIAIERSFTEFMQGDIPLYKNKHLILDSNDRNYLFVYCMALSGVLIDIEKRKEFYNQFFVNKPKYDFCKSAWIDENKKYTNKELLKLLITNVVVTKDKDIYVRDTSFLKFPAYYIYIPTVSDLEIKDTEEVKKESNFRKWSFYTDDKSDEHKDLRSLISALNFKLNNTNFNTRDENICSLSNEYLLMLCYLSAQDTDNIIKYSEKVLEKDKEHFDRCKFIYDYYTNKKEFSHEEMRKNLEKFYDKEYIDNFETFAAKFTFEKLKKIISDNNKFNDKKENFKKRMEQNFEEESQNYDITEKLKDIRNTLSEKFSNNTPNQMNLKEVFDFI